MRKLNLTANDRGQELILTYLQENASEILADKINNGVRITKDNKTLINKKTLDTFMKYANEEARKVEKKGANYTYIEDNTVLSWAIHYFEEDALEGILYNEDGTEYKPAPKVTPKAKTNTKTTTTTTVKEPPKKEIEQLSLFDLVEQEILQDKPKEAVEQKVDKTVKTDIVQAVAEPAIEVETPPIPKPTISPEYKRFGELSTKYPDCIIAIRKGDFYEIMGDQAVILADKLNMSLTSRDYGLLERIPIIGIPYHAMDAYVAKICKTHKLAISIADDHVQVIPILKPLEDEYEDIEAEPDDDLTYEEMREFDGDIEEGIEMQTTTSAKVNTTNNSFNPTALQLVKQILGDTFMLR